MLAERRSASCAPEAPLQRAKSDPADARTLAVLGMTTGQRHDGSCDDAIITLRM